MEKRKALFIYCIVDKRILRLSEEFIDLCPYKYSCNWFPELFILFFCNICNDLYLQCLDDNYTSRREYRQNRNAICDFLEDAVGRDNEVL